MDYRVYLAIILGSMVLTVIVSFFVNTRRFSREFDHMMHDELSEEARHEIEKSLPLELVVGYVDETCYKTASKRKRRGLIRKLAVRQGVPDVIVLRRLRELGFDA